MIARPTFSLGAVEPYWQRTRLWWVERSQREQLLLGALAAVAIFGFLLVAIVAPLRGARNDALTRMRDAALIEAQVRAGGEGALRVGKMRRGGASAILTDSASAARLTIQRIEPDGANTRVVLADAPFDQVIGWIAEIEQTSRLRAGQVRIERKGAAGLVAATLVFAG